MKKSIIFLIACIFMCKGIHAQLFQQGGKLVGIGGGYFGGAAALSADGNTAIIGATGEISAEQV